MHGRRPGGALALDLHGLAFTGMENGLQVTAALATVLGLYRYLEDGRIAPTITGRAWVNAEATLLLDPTDPCCWGIGVSA